MTDKVFALVDCNNFYVSCERVSRPDLKNVPVAVLSNNDGCIIARSKEGNDLGIKMETPVFKVRDLIKEHQIRIFSNNYSLYDNISNRVMQTLETFTPRVEIYSIDEAFLDVSGISHLETYGHQWFGVRVVGQHSTYYPPIQNNNRTTICKTNRWQEEQNKSRNKYHLPVVCPSYSRVSPQNQVYFRTETEAQAVGFWKAGNCG